MIFGRQKPTVKPTARNSRANSASRSDADQGMSNRADEIRGRRAKRSQERINSVSGRIVNPPPSRPVTVRGSYDSNRGKPIHQQVGTRPRRQFYLTMDRTAGTEVRLPAIPVIRPGWRLASGLLAILMAIGIFSMWNSPFCQISTVEVKGLERLDPAEVTARLNLENLSIIEVDPAQVEGKLSSAYPELMNVRVSIALPNSVTVSAKERTPVLAFLQGDSGAGVTNWVDASGVIFPSRGDAGPLVTIQAKDGLPLASAPSDEKQQATQEAPTTKANASTVPVTGPERVDPTVLTALEGLSQKLPPETQLAYSMQDGLGWQAPEGWQVYIGKDLSDFEDKYTMYQQLANYLNQDGLKPALVSVEQINAPYYRLEQ
jgi:cell division protein FtsQ